MKSVNQRRAVDKTHTVSFDSDVYNADLFLEVFSGRMTLSRSCQVVAVKLTAAKIGLSVSVLALPLGRYWSFPRDEDGRSLDADFCTRDDWCSSPMPRRPFLWLVTCLPTADWRDSIYSVQFITRAYGGLHMIKKEQKKVYSPHHR